MRGKRAFFADSVFSCAADDVGAAADGAACVAFLTLGTDGRLQISAAKPALRKASASASGFVVVF